VFRKTSNIQHRTCSVEKIAIASNVLKILNLFVSLSAMKWGRGPGRGGAQGSRGKGFLQSTSNTEHRMNSRTEVGAPEERRGFESKINKKEFLLLPIRLQGPGNPVILLAAPNYAWLLA